MPQPIEEIGQVTLIGAGTMGCANALAAALGGYQAVLFDISEKTLNAVPDTLSGMTAYLEATGQHDKDVLAKALGRIDTCAGLAEALATADLVSESVPENRDIKRQTHAQTEQLAPKHCLLTTNTSGLLVSDIEDAVTDGARFAALHSHLGASLYDIVPGPRTSLETVETLRRYVLSLGGTALVLRKENTGYVLNAMLGSLLTTAQLLLIRERATVQQIDSGWMRHQAASMGPFAMMDLFGLDVVCGSWGKNQAEDVEYHRDTIQPWLIGRVDDGLLGMKTGKGFYTYPDPAYQSAQFMAPCEQADACHQLLQTAVVHKALMIRDNGVASEADIDLAWCVGTHADTGPFRWLSDSGTEVMLRTLEGPLADGIVYSQARDRLMNA